MVGTLFLGLLVLIFLAGLAVLFLGSKTARPAAFGTVAVTGILSLVLTAFLCTTIVSTRNIGIVTTFGKPTGELSNGFHLIAPWSSVTEMDGSIQLQQFTGESYDKPGDAIQCRLGNNSTAFINVNVNWRIETSSAMQLFLDYRDFGTIRNNLVDKQLQVATCHVFSQFNPQATVTPSGTAPATPAANTGTTPSPVLPQQAAQGADLPKLADDIKTELQGAVGDRIAILQVFVPGIFYDGGTQDRINDFNKKFQETRNAEQDVKTAEQQKLAAQQRANRPVPDLTIAISDCVNAAAATNRDAAGCWGQIGGTPLIQLPSRPPAE